MKNFIKILLIILISINIFSIYSVHAWAVDLESIQWLDNITKQSLNWLSDTSTWNWTVTDNIEDLWFSILTIIKYLISWILIIFIVFIWIQMIMSMWSDEEKLSSAKQQLRYTLMWLLFINIPWTFYNMFVSNKWQIDWTINWTWSTSQAVWNESVFINIDAFNQTINWWIVNFLEVMIFTIAVFVIVLSGLKIMTSRGKEEDLSEAKNKILWSLVWLVFIWFIESWQALVFNWKIADWTTIFSTIENLVLFLAWPVAIFFLTLAWYYFITANGDDEKIKKAKSIIINTVIATAILMASHLFLADLSKLSI